MYGNMAEPPAVRALFLHHSTGANLLEEGAVRASLKKQAPAIALWDHGYDPTGLHKLAAPLSPRDHGLRDASGRLLPYSFHVPRNNTDPDGLAELFRQPVGEPPRNALSH